MAKLDEDRIIAAWHRNAEPWATAVRGGQIESRRAVTDGAIVTEVLSHQPTSVLDIGCGEGWLARALAAQGVRVVGVDAVPALIEAAQRAGGADFRIATHADLAAGALAQRFDVAVANFALLGKESVEALFAAVPRLVQPGGAFIVQTLHPLLACGEQPYRDGWRAGSWAGIPGEFGEPAPWYFRTLASWVQLFADHGLCLRSIREPIHPATGRPASVILSGR